MIKFQLIRFRSIVVNRSVHTSVFTIALPFSTNIRVGTVTEQRGNERKFCLRLQDRTEWNVDIQFYKNELYVLFKYSTQIVCFVSYEMTKSLVPISPMKITGHLCVPSMFILFLCYSV